MFPVGNLSGAYSGHSDVSGSDGDLASSFHDHLQSTSERSSGANVRLETVTMDTASHPTSVLPPSELHLP